MARILYPDGYVRPVDIMDVVGHITADNCFDVRDIRDEEEGEDGE